MALSPSVDRQRCRSGTASTESWTIASARQGFKSQHPMDTAKTKKGPQWLRPILIGIAIIGIGGFFASRYFAPKPEKGVILASGTIEADETTIAPKVPGRLKLLKVNEGDDVKQGELLAKLDDSELRAQLGQAEAGLAAAQAKFDEAVKGNRPEQIAQAVAQLEAAKQTAAGSHRLLATSLRNMHSVLDLQTQLDSAEAKVTASEAAYRQSVEALKLTMAGTRPEQVDQAKVALLQAHVALAHAGTDLARMKILADQGAIAVQNYDDALAVRDVDQKLVEQAQAHYNDLLAGSRPEEIRGSQQAVAAAKANLDGARKALIDARRTFSDRLTAQGQVESQSTTTDVAIAQVAAAQAQLDLMKAGSRAEDIESARATRDQASHAVDYAKQMVADTVLYAPTSGVVKTKDSLLGETLSAGTPVVTIADLDHIWIRVFVPEDQYGALKLGQSVDVKVDSFPKEIFRGHIVSINTDSEFTPKNAQTPEERVTLVFGVKIMIDNPGRRLKPGMPGDATIRTQ